MFSAVSYASRNKYLSTNDKIYSTVVQETQAKMALSEVMESIFQYNFSRTRTCKRKRSGLLSRTGPFHQQIRLCLFKQLWVKQQNPQKRLLSWFCFSRKLCRNTQRNQEDFQCRNGKELQNIASF